MSLDGISLSREKKIIVVDIIQQELNRRERVETFKRSPLKGAKEYFPHRFIYDYSPFHYEAEKIILDLAQPHSNAKHNQIAPRGIAKSECFCFLLPMYCISFGTKHFILILSDTHGQAVAHIVSIRDEITTNDKYRNDFGKKETSTWSTKQIVTTSTINNQIIDQLSNTDLGGLDEDLKVKDDDEDKTKKEGTIRLIADDTLIMPLGTRQKIRGRKFRHHRPDLAVLDDPDNDENVATVQQRDKTWRWFRDALMHSGNIKNFAVVTVGTAVHQECLVFSVKNKLPDFKSKLYKALLSFPDNMELWETFRDELFYLENENRLEDALAFYKANKEEMDKGAEVLWEEGYPLVKAMIDYFIDKTGFMKERQNDPKDRIHQIFDPDSFVKFNLIDRLENAEYVKAVAVLDPAVGTDKQETKKPKGAYPAMTIEALDKYGYIDVLDAKGKRGTPLQQLEDFLDFIQAWKKHPKIGKVLLKAYIEKVAYQKVARDIVKNEVKKRMIPISVYGLEADSNKIARISSHEPDIANGFTRFASNLPSEVFSQYEYFPTGDYMDFPDVIEMGKRALMRKGIRKLGDASKPHAKEDKKQQANRIRGNALPCEEKHPYKSENVPHERISRILTLCEVHKKSNCDTCPLGDYKK